MLEFFYLNVPIKSTRLKIGDRIRGNLIGILFCIQLASDEYIIFD